MLRTILLMFLSTLVACESPALTGVAPCLAHDMNFRVPLIGPPPMDLLLVVDNTRGMEAAQTALAAEMPRLVETLRSGIQRDGRRLPPPSAVRIGVITSDMGAAGFETDTCNFSGDDGLLQLDPACTSEDLPFLALRSDIEVSEGFGAQLRCAVYVGANECEFSQPLEALLKAVTPASSELTFAVGGQGGHAGLNGFINGSSLAGVIVLTSADDCSVADDELFNPEGAHADVPLRCQAEGALHPLERFIDGLASAQYLDSIAFGVIAGVPPDLIADPIAPDYGALIGPERDPRMRIGVTPFDPTQLGASCDALGVDGSSATPPLRLVELLQRLEEADAAVVLGSICAPNFGSFVDAFAEQLGLLNRDCLPRPLERDQDGRVRCNVLEVLDDANCADRRSEGRVLLHVDEDGREVCHVCQSNPEGVLIDTHPECQALADEGATSVGWFYEEGESVRGCAPGRRQIIDFFVASQRTPNAILRLECPLRDDEAALGQSCSATRPCEPQLDDLASVCDATSGTCQAPCEHDSDCAPAGLTYQCVNYGDDGTRYCLNSTCQ